ncbi:MAG: hypothetical protein WBG90_18495 [Saonia sp.]
MSDLYAPDVVQQERKAGQKAARTLRRDLRTILGTLSIKSGSQLFKNTKITTITSFGTLDHLAVITPHYIFKQHYGFEGIKKNGVAMSMKPFLHFDKLFAKTRALDKLLDEIGAIRAEEITRNIRF